MNANNVRLFALAVFLLGSSLRNDLASAQPPAVQVKFLEQGWSDQDRNWFYSANQGSHLVPYDWFVALEVADGEQLFRDVKKKIWSVCITLPGRRIRRRILTACRSALSKIQPLTQVDSSGWG